jgi:L-ribulose-5-phosphate 4-epimerase|tara:strand:- start:412 stop:1083 length:672 start_codon:yes stop_codon:yes gene_type:complete
VHIIKKKECHKGNLKIASSNLIFQNFGNLSLRINRKLFVIKPSGVNLKKTRYQDYPVISINEEQNKNKLKPSVDTDFHLEIYKNFEHVNCIIHTHSKYATIWAQACKSIPNLGTTHSDYWLKEIPITNILSKKQIHSNYEKNIGKNIVKLLKKKFCYGALIANHGPITFGRTLEETILYAERLEYISETAYKTILLNKDSKINQDLINKHYFRKHGKKSYYGQ